MSYIQQIIGLLQVDEFVGKHEYIEIAKGKYKLHNSIKELWKQGIREIKVKRNGRKKNNRFRD
jgi:hypothetical protein